MKLGFIPEIMRFSVRLVTVGLLCATPAFAQDGYPCVIQPSRETVISVNVPGVLASVEVERGQDVAEGDILATLRNSVEVAAVALARRRAEDMTQIEGAQQRLALLEAQLDRARSMLERELIAQTAVDDIEGQMVAVGQELDRVRADQAIAALELERVEAQLARMVVRAPIAGTVTERAAEPGEYASEQRPILQIATLDPLAVEVFVPVDLHDRLTVGGTATVRPQLVEAGAHDARIEVIDRVFDAASGTFGLRLSLPNPNGTVPAGIRCRVNFAESG